MGNRDYRKLEIYIGAFIITGIILIMGMILTTSEGVLLQETYKIIVRIDHVSDLRPGAPVKLGGVNIGQVADIRLDVKKVIVELEVDKKRDIPKGSYAQIGTSGLVGDSFMEIVRGEGKEILPKNDPERPPVIQGKAQPGTAELLQQVNAIGAEVETLVQNLNRIVGDEQSQKNIRESFANVNASTVEAKKLLASLNHSAGRIDDAIANVVDTTKRVKGISGTVEGFVNETIGDEEQVAAINKTIANVHKITGTLGDKSDEIGGMVGDLKATTATVAQIVAQIEPDQGLPKLLTDPQLEADIRRMLEDLRKLADGLTHVGAVDLLADQKMADVIAKRFLHECERKGIESAEEIAKEWSLLRVRLGQIKSSLSGALSEQPPKR